MGFAGLMTKLLDDIRLYLPKYLSAEEQKVLLTELAAFPNNLDKRFYTTALQSESVLFQGDGFDDVTVPDVEGESFHTAKAMLISNTCDSSLDNPREYYRPFILLAPIFDLNKYENGLLKSGDKLKVASHINSIRKQAISPLFYLPASSGLGKECFVRLDCIFSRHLSEGLKNSLLKAKLFTLSDYGFYMLIFKLSVHFSRAFEGVHRNPYEN